MYFTVKSMQNTWKLCKFKLFCSFNEQNVYSTCTTYYIKTVWSLIVLAWAHHFKNTTSFSANYHRFCFALMNLLSLLALLSAHSYTFGDIFQIQTRFFETWSLTRDTPVFFLWFTPSVRLLWLHSYSSSIICSCSSIRNFLQPHPIATLLLFVKAPKIIFWECFDAMVTRLTFRFFKVLPSRSFIMSCSFSAQIRSFCTFSA